ncbi:Hypothetical predicted protein [Mytilus galloprovincialis]|uniref:Uncharacterized protein n=1 Tax=Mytilus galloprovincialis TaxID=29158 RepID=A0A8B6G1Q7_MYTGA|nr:Hypothetical predicted protein [Mytilus galloprovincialis]
MHDLQRHIKHWCPENESFKRKRDSKDLDNENPSKKSASEWIEYDGGSDDSSEDVNIDDNEGYKTILHAAIDTAKDTWDKKYDKYVKEDPVTKDLQSPLFEKTRDDDKPGQSYEDKMFMKQMDNEFVRDSEGSWVAPLPFRVPRQPLPSNRQQALHRANMLDMPV